VQTDGSNYAWNGTEWDKLGGIVAISAALRDVSATQSGIVNTISLQELGGVDKTINGVRIGRGGGNRYGNTAIGDGALSKNINGAPNTAIGSGALYYNQDGSANIAVGFNSGANLTEGNRNVFVGNLQGTGITTGNDNLVISQGNGLSNGVTTGSGNTIIGKVTGLADDLANSILITNGIGNVGFSHISDQGTKLPSQTNAFINSDITGKAAITKEYVDSVIKPYKVYVALLTQTGMSAPVATVLENTLGGRVLWSRNTHGNYTGTLVGALALNKTIGFVQSNDPSRPLSFNANNSANSFEISTNGADDILINATIEIRVYN
jgi:hypothetical protein